MNAGLLCKRRTIRAVIILGGVAVLPLLMGAVSAPQAGPSDCSSSFDPYAYTQAQVSACGYQTFSQSSVNPMTGGGFSYDYNVDGATVQFYVPPAGFNPSTATNAQLDEYGFPERPTDPSALAAWQTDMNTWTGAVTPPSFLAETNSDADSTYTNNWAGFAVTGSNAPYTHAETSYLEPSFGSSVCSSNADVTWAGIGGYMDGKGVSQDGTTHNVPGAYNHQAWWEIYPWNHITPVNLYGHAGYKFYASTQYLGSGNGYRYYMKDYYTGHTIAFDVSHDQYDGSSAEAVTERPTIGGSLSNLSNFGSLTFVGSTVDGHTIDTYSASSSRHGVHMEDYSTGDMLATPGTIGSGGSFAVTQDHCN